MNDRARDLINGWCSGSLGEAEHAELESTLRASPQARRLLLRYRAMETALRSQALGAESVGALDPEPRSRLPRRVLLSGMAAAAAMVILLLVSPWPGASDRIEVIEVVGALSGAGEGGAQALVRGDVSGPGVLETIGPDSAATIRFEDGSLISLDGDSRLAVLPGKQDQVRLLAGKIYSDITPQAEGLPFVIETPTARFEVLGTSFEIAADEQASRLEVTEGEVRTIRRADGEMVEVPEAHFVIASLETDVQLEATPQPLPVLAWSRRASAGPMSTIGQWEPEVGGAPSRLVATPFRFEKPGREPMTVYRAAFGRKPEATATVELHPDSFVTVRGRIAEPTEVEVMLNTRIGGSFGGNFFARFHPEPGGWFERVIPVSDFVGERSDEEKRVPRGALLQRIFLINLHSDVGLEFEGCQLSPGS